MAIVHVTKDNFKEVVQSDKTVLLDFWANWCAPCKMLAPVIDRLAEQYAGRVKVAKIDIDEHSALAERYDIQSIPTILLFKDGKVTARDVGAKPLSNYTAMLDANLQIL